ncbi:hypothetical protein GCM10027073_46270 [Streptomyces chlorus]
MVESNNLAVTLGDTGGMAFDNELIAELSSHDRRRFLKMLLYPTCHARGATAWDEKPGSGEHDSRFGAEPSRAWLPTRSAPDHGRPPACPHPDGEATCTIARSQNS